MLMSDKWIKHQIAENMLIAPVEYEPSKGRKISFGINSYGYDVRLNNSFKIFDSFDIQNKIIDPKNFDFRICKSYTNSFCIIPAHSFMLAETIEYFRMPRNILGLLVGKSTYARCGIHLSSTVLQPEWRGRITLEITNSSPLPVKLYVGEGIGQILFFHGDQDCEKSYQDSLGKYQDQVSVTLPVV